jgi:hypothetical protein
METKDNLPATTSPKASPVRSPAVRQIGQLILTLLSLYWTANDDPALRELQAEAWLESLEPFELDDISVACREWREHQNRRPTIADIRAIIIAKHDAIAGALQRARERERQHLEREREQEHARQERERLEREADPAWQLAECQRRYGPGPDHCRARYRARKWVCRQECKANIPEYIER